MLNLVDRSYEPRLSRTGCQQVDGLRDAWRSLVVTSDRITANLLREKRVIFEQELDKQVKVSNVHAVRRPLIHPDLTHKHNYAFSVAHFKKTHKRQVNSNVVRDPRSCCWESSVILPNASVSDYTSSDFTEP